MAKEKEQQALIAAMFMLAASKKERDEAEVAKATTTKTEQDKAIVAHLAAVEKERDKAKTAAMLNRAGSPVCSIKEGATRSSSSKEVMEVT